jgi:plastocyanin
MRRATLVPAAPRRGPVARAVLSRTILFGAVLAAGVLVALAPSPARAGEVRGVVRLAGAPPPAGRLEVTKDRSACGESVPDEQVQVANGLLANVVVTVKGAPAPRPGKAVLDQQRCRFVPHVQAVAVGSTLEIVNGDEILHNVHGYVGPSTAFNVAMPTRNQRVPRRLDRPGLVAVRCDVHAWMSAFVLVSDAPFAVTGPDGTFSVPDVPPGTYAVRAWHESLGERTASVTVPATGAATVEIAFGR